MCKTNKKALRSYEKLHFDVVGERAIYLTRTGGATRKNFKNQVQEVGKYANRTEKTTGQKMKKERNRGRETDRKPNISQIQKQANTAFTQKDAEDVTIRNFVQSAAFQKAELHAQTHGTVWKDQSNHRDGRSIPLSA